MKSMIVLAAALAAAAAGRTAGPGVSPAPADSTTGYPAAIGHILDQKCAGCHGAARSRGGLRLDSWEHLLQGGTLGAAVIPGDPGRSLLLRLTTSLKGGPHPAERGRDSLTAAERETIAGWIRDGAQSGTGRQPFADASHLLYVCNQDEASVSIIDMATNLVVGTVDLQALGFSDHAKPHHIVVEPDGSAWYVSLIGDGKVLKFDRNNRLVGQASMETPGMMSLNPKSDLLYVGHSMTAVNPPQRVGVIRRSDMSIEEADVFIPRPHALVADPGGRWVYTASLGTNQLVTMDSAGEDVQLRNVDGPHHMFVQFAVAPAQHLLVASTEMSGKLMIWDAANPPELKLLGEVSVGGGPYDPVITPDGRYAWLGNKQANTVTVVDLVKRSVDTVIAGNGIAEPHGTVVSPDGKYVYVSNNNLKGEYTSPYDTGEPAPRGTVVVLSTADRRIVKVIEVGRNPSGMGTRSTP
ncbi:MAG: c-type cytochrome domain-containing protein [Gemmatimonadales bacterium]